MPPNDTAVQSAADAIFVARGNAEPIDKISETFGITDPVDAYAVQERNTARWIEAGRPLTGRKIGLTSEAVQKQMGVGEPDYGMIWGDLGFENGAVLPIERFAQPRAEAEIAFVMKRGLESNALELADVIDAIDTATAAVEVVDSAIKDWKITLPDTIADNASGGGYVLGRDRLPLDAIDLEGCRMTLKLNGKLAAEGVGAACLGNPVNAVLWLARKMVEVGRPLSAGDIVLSGALGPMKDVGAGDRVEVEIEGFEPLSVSFSTGEDT